MMLYTLVMQFYFQNGLKQKKMTPFWGKNTEEEQNSATTIISVDGKGTSPMKSKLQGQSFQKTLKKEHN